MLNYQIIPVTPFQQNCTVFWCETTRHAAVIDPGGEVDKIISQLKHLQVQAQCILLTHGHLDHVGGTAELAQRLQIPIFGPHPDDQFWIDSLPQQCQMFGFPPVVGFTPDRWLNHGDTVNLGDKLLQVIHTPGHTPGHVVFYHAPSRLAQVGDVLFRGSIGRTDFPRGDHATLIASIRQRLLPLGADVRFIPGHGPMSSFGAEQRDNPFLLDD